MESLFLSVEPTFESSSSPRIRRATRRLFCAIHRNDLPLARRVLGYADINFRERDSGKTALELATEKYRRALVKMLCPFLPSQTAQEHRSSAISLLLQSWPREPLQARAALGCLDELLAGTSLPCIAPAPGSGWFAVAIAQDNPFLANVLLERGARLEETSAIGEGLLHQAVELEAWEMVDWLLAKMPEPLRFAPDNHGESALHVAARQGALTWVIRMVAAGACLEQTNSEGIAAYDLLLAADDACAFWARTQSGSELTKRLPPALVGGAHERF